MFPSLSLLSIFSIISPRILCYYIPLFFSSSLLIVHFDCLTLLNCLFLLHSTSLLYLTPAFLNLVPFSPPLLLSLFKFYSVLALLLLSPLIHLHKRSPHPFFTCFTTNCTNKPFPPFPILYSKRPLVSTHYRQKKLMC